MKIKILLSTAHLNWIQRKNFIKTRRNISYQRYNLFYLLLVNKEIVVSREKILEEVWGFDYEGEEKIVDVYINSLRKKIDEGNEKYIHTARGFGYILKRE
ncbi:MAG: winged helix-turn-helix domain-containing protein [Fusobacterium sp.]